MIIIARHLILRRQIILFIFFLLFVCFALSCSKTTTVKSSRQDMLKSDKQLEDTYNKIIIHRFEIEQYLEKIYPGAAAACENSAMDELLKIGSVPVIEKARSKSIREDHTVIVKARVTTLRIIHNTKQISGKASSRNSEMAVNLQLIDAATGRVLREKSLSSTQLTSPAAEENVSSQHTLSAELGIMIARFITSVIRTH
jgi:hypothetical protein